MSSRMLLVPALLTTLLAGCGGVSEEDFTSESIDITCSKFFECFDSEVLAFMGYTDEATCVDMMTTAADDAEPDESCEFDGAKGQECLDAWDAVTCDDMASAEFTVDACDDLCK